MITMGMKLRQLRKQNGYRQSDISDIIGKKTGTITI